MKNFPLVCNYEGDYAMKVLMVSPEDTMDDVVRIAKENLVGIVLPPPKPGAVMRVRRHGGGQDLPGDLKVSEANFIEMETIDIYQSEP